MRHLLPKVMCVAALAASLASKLSAQTATVAVDATSTVRVVDERVFGINVPFWDDTFTSAKTTQQLSQMGIRFMRFGGGSATDEYNWQNGTDLVSGSRWAFNIDDYAAQQKAIGAQSIITVNYGSAQPSDAAAYVNYANVKQGYGFKYWEIGNECYGTWEYDLQSKPHDPYTYATRAVQYIEAMRAVDPTIKIGVVAVTGEDSNSNGYTTSVTNPRTNVAHSGWVPVVLATMKAANQLPDFLIYHRYDGSPGSENDSVLLQAALTWPTDAANLRQMLNDYLGTSASSVELLVTENNSVYGNPGKQSVSLVNGLYMADSIANVMQTEFNSLVWWDLHNGQSFNSATNVINVSSSLYGWRIYGDYGVEYQATGDQYPPYYIEELLSHFARGGDTVIKASSNANLLSAYAVKRKDGTLSILAINKSPTASYTTTFNIAGFTPQGSATIYSYGIPQDENAEENSQPVAAPLTSSFENSMDGWVNQSGQPDNSTTNYGQSGPFLYTLGYSTTTGVTDGTYSLAATTTAPNPGPSAVIVNTTSSMGTAMSTASSVAFDVYPQISGGGAVTLSLYINGTNVPGTTPPSNYSLVGSAQTVNANQESTVTFALTDAQRAGIAASLSSGDFFQVGINVTAAAPLTVYFDKFVITPKTSTTTTPTVIAGAASSPDVAVSTLSGAGPTFTATFAPYSASVVSLTGPVTSPVASAQPASVTVASGHTATFSFPTAGSPTPSYQWYLNGAAIAGATNSTLIVSGTTSANQGAYTCTATNSSGAVTSSAANLTVITTSDPGRLINLSCRAEVGTGANILFGGFAIGGSGTSGPQSVLVRASGPAIAAAPFNVPGTLPDPNLQLFDSTSTAIPGDLNDAWGGTAQIANTANAVHAFAWGDPKSHDAALDLALAPGAYTAQVSGQSGDTGDALMEVYDATPAGSYTAASSRLVNLSSRVNVGTGSNSLIAGFVIGGSTSVTVLIRASGPALTQFGVAGVLPDPVLVLQNAAGTAIAKNSSWGGDPVIASVASTVAFKWPDSGSHDSALLLTLPPGAYTANVSGASNDTGVGLVEVYEIQ